MDKSSLPCFTSPTHWFVLTPPTRTLALYGHTPLFIRQETADPLCDLHADSNFWAGFHMYPQSVFVFFPRELDIPSRLLPPGCSCKFLERCPPRHPIESPPPSPTRDLTVFFPSTPFFFHAQILLLGLSIVAAEFKRRSPSQRTAREIPFHPLFLANRPSPPPFTPG